jgi:hypothetical protein
VGAVPARKNFRQVIDSGKNGSSKTTKDEDDLVAKLAGLTGDLHRRPRRRH